MATENGTANSPYTGKTVKIRTNIGWVEVVTSTKGYVTEAALNAAIKALQDEINSNLDNKLDKSAYLESQSIDELLANTK